VARPLTGSSWEEPGGGRITVLDDPLAGVVAQTPNRIGEWKGRQVRVRLADGRSQWITVEQIEKKYRRIGGSDGGST
jgi:hypothetical protein